MLSMGAMDRKLQQACQKAKKIAGGNVALAKALAAECRIEITSQAVSQWKIIPYKRVLEVSKVTGIPPRELRPDLASLME